MGIESFKNPPNIIIDLRFLDEVEVRVCSDRKTIRHTDPFLPELPVHLSKRGILPADDRHIDNPKFRKPEDELFAPRDSGSKMFLGVGCVFLHYLLLYHVRP